ncbi:MAG: TRAM domain-containing protein [Chloroflexota bacterium]
MSIEFVFRIIGMAAFGILFGYWGASFSTLAGGQIELYAIVFGMVGALIGLVLTPYITIRPLRSIRGKLLQQTPQGLFAGLVGLVVGLLIAALLSFPLSLLPSPFGKVLPFVGVLLFAYFGVALFIIRQHDIVAMLRVFAPGQSGGVLAGGDSKQRKILVDTSVLIDGRIADVVKTGFLSGSLIIPRFILNELQYIADSADNVRRQRGRRGLNVIADLQSDPVMPVIISDIDIEGARDVDDKLVLLARKLRYPIMTNDYNLNRVAELQGVVVLNVNELANAVKTILLPGERMEVRIMQEGKETGQGVGYLEDGTMVVVESGLDYLQRQIRVEVTKVLQTAAGRMIFARPMEEE